MIMSMLGILHQRSYPRTSQQNDIVERKHKYILDVTHTLMQSMKVPKYLGSDVILTVSYFINRMLSTVFHGDVPFQRIFLFFTFLLESLSVFCARFISQLILWDQVCFCGILQNSKGCQCYDPTTRLYFTFTNVTFFESTLYLPLLLQRMSKLLFLFPLLVLPQLPLTHCRYTLIALKNCHQFKLKPMQLPVLQILIFLLLSVRINILLLLILFHILFHMIVFTLYFVSLPYPFPLSLFQELHKGYNSTTLKSYYRQRDTHITITKHLGANYFFSYATVVDRYKAYLVAKGFTQTFGVNYTQTFSPVTRLNSIRVLLFISNNRTWELHQLDIKIHFYMVI